jgi:hypothetical protein
LGSYSEVGVSGFVPVGSFGGARYDPFYRLEGRRLGKKDHGGQRVSLGRFRAALKD